MAPLDMFNTCKGIENELSKNPVLSSQPTVLYVKWQLFAQKKIIYEYKY